MLITVTKLATYLDTSKMAASRRAKKAIKEGWLVNHEFRKGYPADYIPGEPIPQTDGLPTLEDLCNTITDRNTPPVTDFSFKDVGCNTVTPLTDDEILSDTPTNDYNNNLGMTVDQALELWRQHGAPVIHLRQGENCLDLVKLLSQHDVNPEHLAAVRGWLQEHKGGDK